MTKRRYKVTNMHCTSCAAVIESELEDAGVKAVCSFAKETLDVEFDERTMTETHITELVANAGYTISQKAP